MNIVDLIFNFESNLFSIIQGLGDWSYFLFFIIIFCETGLVVTPFLPGDSLLFALGAISAKGTLNVVYLSAILTGAAIIGDSANYAIGSLFGEKILLKERHHFIKKEHINKTHRFYEKYGGKTIILARFVPIIRTFAPFIAGIGKMSYWKFLFYNITGAVLWVGIVLSSGYFFGNIPVVRNNFSLVILGIIIISLFPIGVEFIKHKRQQAIKARS